MNAPRPGDRVRVVLEGEVGAVTDNGFFVGRTWIAPNDDPGVSVEILRPPVKVGDVIETAEQLDALPLGAVIIGTGRAPGRRQRDGWYFADGTTTPTTPTLPATVLYLPDGAA